MCNPCSQPRKDKERASGEAAAHNSRLHSQKDNWDVEGACHEDREEDVVASRESVYEHSDLESVQVAVVFLWPLQRLLETKKTLKVKLGGVHGSFSVVKRTILICHSTECHQTLHKNAALLIFKFVGV